MSKLAAPILHNRSTDGAVVAAVDLGSNSFHMVIARLDLGKLCILDKMREQVRLAAGLSENNHLDRQAQARAVACLERFGERLQNMSATDVRVVGTNTLRSATNADEFLPRLREAIGHPIEIVSGREEARLIYLGVAHDLVNSEGQRLVVDIGGGSTECIIGKGFEPIRGDSLHMGCVIFSQRFFPEGKLRPEYFKEAELAAASELRSIKNSYARVGWDEAIGASGTIQAIETMIRAQGWSESITADSLDRLKRLAIASGRTSRLELDGLETERRDVFPGGLAILAAVFRSLRVERMTASGGALREGVLYDLLGRRGDEDIRNRTVKAMAKRYGVDAEHAQRVEATALAMLSQVQSTWELEDPRAKRYLAWSAQLHEIGLAIAYSGHHKHGEYLIANSDMPGFSRGEQRALARLVRVHRRKFKPESFSDLNEPEDRFLRRLAVLLRLAVALNRARVDGELPPMQLNVHEGAVEIRFPDGWLARHPMSQLELDREGQRYRVFGVRLRYS